MPTNVKQSCDFRLQKSLAITATVFHTPPPIGRQKQSPAAVSDTPELVQSVLKLTEEVSRLADDVRVLRDAIDDFRGEYEWAVRNAAGRRAGKRHIVQLTSMAAEANRPDWKEKLNSQGPNSPIAKPEEDGAQSAPTEGSLW